MTDRLPNADLTVTCCPRSPRRYGHSHKGLCLDCGLPTTGKDCPNALTTARAWPELWTEDIWRIECLMLPKTQWGHLSHFPTPQKKTSHLLGLMARQPLPTVKWRPQEPGRTVWVLDHGLISVILTDTWHLEYNLSFSVLWSHWWLICQLNRQLAPYPKVNYHHVSSLVNSSAG